MVTVTVTYDLPATTLVFNGMDDLYNLELLSLVAKITQEIYNHTGKCYLLLV